MISRGAELSPLATARAVFPILRAVAMLANPGLPEEDMLITRYATLWIVLPFLFFWERSGVCSHLSAGVVRPNCGAIRRLDGNETIV